MNESLCIYCGKQLGDSPIGDERGFWAITQADGMAVAYPAHPECVCSVWLMVSARRRQRAGLESIG